jgi:DNA-binding transcriptional MerR regulator
MLNLSELKQTRFYQEVKQEGIEEGLEQGREQGREQAKLEAIPRLLEFGLSLEQIAQCLDVSLEFVQQTITHQIQGKFMPFSEKIIYTFIELLTQQRSIFSSEQLDELNQLVEPLSDDVDTLSNQISLWIDKNPKIKESQDKLLDKMNGNSSEKAPGSGEGNIPKPIIALNKKTLKNAIQQGSVSDQSQSSKNK